MLPHRPDVHSSLGDRRIPPRTAPEHVNCWRHLLHNGGSPVFPTPHREFLPTEKNKSPSQAFLGDAPISPSPGRGIREEGAGGQSLGKGEARVGLRSGRCPAGPYGQCGLQGLRWDRKTPVFRSGGDQNTGHKDKVRAGLETAYSNTLGWKGQRTGCLQCPGRDTHARTCTERAPGTGAVSLRLNPPACL